MRSPTSKLVTFTSGHGLGDFTILEGTAPRAKTLIEEQHLQKQQEQHQEKEVLGRMLSSKQSTCKLDDSHSRTMWR